LTTLRHGIACIGRQVHQHLLDSRWIPVDGKPFTLESDRDLDGLGQGALEQFGRLLGECQQVHGVQFNLRATTEVQDLLDEFTGLMGLLLDHFQPPSRLLVELRLLRRHLAVEDDDRHDVIEVVGDASGELSNSGQALLLPELQFKLAALSDIPHHALDGGQPSLVVGHSCGTDLDP